MGTVGFVGPPMWDDPSPAEYRAITGHDVLRYRLDAPDGFRWALEEIAGFEPATAAAATDLARQGADVVGIVGTPFGWAGLVSGETPRDRNERIGDACGVPVVSAVSGIIDRLDAIGARTVALAVTYYDRSWKHGLASVLHRLGFPVSVALSLEDLGLIAGPVAADDPTHWEPTGDQIVANVRALATEPADAIIVAGAGARTLSLAADWASVTSIPVVAADTALYATIDASLAGTRDRPHPR